MREKDLEMLVLDYLNKRGIFAFKIQTVGIWDADKKVYRNLSKFCLRGTSDILGVMPNGRFLAIEMKGPKGRATQEQLAFISKVKRQGGVAFIARGIEDIDKEFKREQIW